MLELPKPYLSYSQVRVWLEDKDQYRRRYYMRQDMKETKALQFGKKVADSLEAGIKYEHLITYPVMEHQIKVDIDEVPFFAYLDTFDPKRLKFREYKTGQKTTTGKDRWNQKAVEQHTQLDIYSLLIQEAHGGVDDETHLDWLEVRRKSKKFDFDGHVLEGENGELELTGRVETFTRMVTQQQRDIMRHLIRSIAIEIAADWKRWREHRNILPGRDFVN